MTAQQLQLWLWWIVSTLGGWGIGLLVGQLFPSFPILPWAIGVGLGQWIFLRTQLENSEWWILATALTLLIFAPVSIIRGDGNSALVWAVVGAIVGTIVAVTQWFVLSRQLPDAIWWIPTSVMGWSIAWGFGGAVYDLLLGVGTGPTAAYFLGCTAGWTGTSLITGFVLVSLLRGAWSSEV